MKSNNTAVQQAEATVSAWWGAIAADVMGRPGYVDGRAQAAYDRAAFQRIAGVEMFAGDEETENVA